jgi:hypothetical protein
MVHRVQVRSISNDEGNRLLQIVRRSIGSVVTWRRAQMVLLSAQCLEAAAIAAGPVTTLATSPSTAPTTTVIGSRQP